MLDLHPVGDTTPAFEYPNGEIRAVAYSPEIRDLAFVTRDGVLAIWSREPAGVMAEFIEKPVEVESVVFSPDRKTIAAAWRHHRKVKLWGVNHLQGGPGAKGVVGLDEEDAFAMAFSADGKSLAIGGEKPTVQIWDLERLVMRTECFGHLNAIRSLAFHPDGRTVVSSSDDGTVQFWDAKTGRRSRKPMSFAIPATEPIMFGDPASCLAISPDGRFLAFPAPPGSRVSPGDPERLAPYDKPPASTCIRCCEWTAIDNKSWLLEGGRDAILSLAFSPDSRILASAGGLQHGEGEVKLWDMAAGKLLADLKGHRRTVKCLAFSPDGRILVTAGGVGTGPGEIKLWDLDTLPGGRPVRR